MAISARSARGYDEEIARALDPAVRGTELVALAAHRDVRVRAVVASRTDAPMASLISLAHERDGRVLTALANNPASPRWVLQKLAYERDEAIRDRALARLRAIDATR